MEATCKNCNHWENETTQRDDLGECDVLGNEEMAYVLPVVEEETKPNAHILTKADFGCNQFSPE